MLDQYKPMHTNTYTMIRRKSSSSNLIRQRRALVVALVYTTDSDWAPSTVTATVRHPSHGHETWTYPSESLVIKFGGGHRDRDWPGPPGPPGAPDARTNSGARDASAGRATARRRPAATDSDYGLQVRLQACIMGLRPATAGRCWPGRAACF